MRSEEEMMKLLVEFAGNDDRIRLATLEGSRTNANIPPDPFQDYDVSCFVTDLDSFKETDDWLLAFGSRLMMQKPEAMELFPPELGNRFSYLILFEDGSKLDLTLIPIGEAEAYFAGSDGLVRVLLDKDGLVRDEPVPDDRQYWIRKPTAGEFDDCCNEYWMVSTYVVKGLARKEILFAIDHLNGVMCPQLLRMMAWRIGAERSYTFSVGKNCKFIDRYLPDEDWKALLSTFSENGYEEMWKSLFACHELFRKYANAVAGHLGYAYPDYDEAVAKHTMKIYRSLP
ncbi:aminoglycoside 6-adenylyltransferase [Cohnella zeiphila]|uniref:Aminoglycoside 6-adenylyltransferase n=1 Tax=Cohnella zeiphila TaxID=2761120 RepID=A0A7X0SK60_9BACL|nr:aminoglycoside 6-adenylyltransferase [Cohnella zeiphila]MBB6730200.1 aminoglycoside 6-adenylyltransferase [Cohnella zeiphila]